MQTVTVQLMNEKALALLEQLEQLNVLKLISNDEKEDSKELKRNWSGSISKETGKKLLNYVEESRNEWDRNI